MKKYLLFINFYFLIIQIHAQKITGYFPLLSHQKVFLNGFKGLTNYLIDSIEVSEVGVFNLNYSDKDRGMGYISTKTNDLLIICLENENIQLRGTKFSEPDSIFFLNGSENNFFKKYSTEHTKREQVINAWSYLKNSYQSNIFLQIPQKNIQIISSELKRLEYQDLDFINNLPQKSYIKWYLPIRKLISKVPIIAQLRINEIPEIINAFRNIEYKDPRLFKSGLLNSLIESQYWLLENRGMTLEKVFEEMNLTTNIILNDINENENLYNEISKYLFNYFEKHSLFNPANYLSNKVLNDNKVKINPNLKNQLESYRFMKVGNIAPDIQFSGETYRDNKLIYYPKKLSDIQNNYKVVIFGASWCPDCAIEMLKLISLYSDWKSKGIEIVFVSMDTNSMEFKNFTSIMPFISFCDYKKWESQAVKDYYITSSPTIFLLDKGNKIIFRTGIVMAIDTWVKHSFN